MLTLVGGLLTQSYGNYMVMLQREFAWSATTLSAAYSLVRVEGGLLGPLQGWLIDRYGPRTNIRAGIVVLGVGFLLFSRVQTLSQFFTAFVMMAVGAAFTGIMPLSVTIVSWFQRARSRALSVLMAGVSAGGLLVPLSALAMERWGWRATAAGSGLLCLTGGLALTRVFHHRPEDIGESIDGATTGRTPAVRNGAPSGDADVEYSARQALRTLAFWTISLGHACALLIVSTVMVHLVPHLSVTLGYPLAQASLGLLLVTSMHFIGILAGGVLGDRYNKRLLAVACGTVHGIALLILAFATSWFTVVVFAVLHGLAWGVRGPLMQAIRADYFGRQSYGKILGFSSMLIMFGSMGGPLITGVLFDHFGGYRPALTIMAVAGPLCAIFFALARPPTQRVEG